MFVDSQRRDILDADASSSRSYSAYYSLANTLLTPEPFAARFLVYIVLGHYSSCCNPVHTIIQLVCM